MNTKSSIKPGLKRFLLRYFPPGIILEYANERGDVKTQTIDLLDLNSTSNPDLIADSIIREVDVLSSSKRPQILKMINKLISRQNEGLIFSRYNLSLKFKPHSFPLTNAFFNKTGTRVITSSHDRTSKIWNTETGSQLFQLSGHTNVVFISIFNNPFSDKILTGSFDRTVRVWDAQNGAHLHTLCSNDEDKQMSEVLTLASSQRKANIAASGGLNGDCIVWDINEGKMVSYLLGHTASIVALSFHPLNDLLISASFDGTVRLWDYSVGSSLHTMNPLQNVHRLVSSAKSEQEEGKTKLASVSSALPSASLSEIASANFTFTGEMISVSTFNGTFSLFETETGKNIANVSLPSNAVCSALSPSSSLAAIGLDNGEIFVYRIVIADIDPSTLNEDESRVSLVPFASSTSLSTFTSLSSPSSPQSVLSSFPHSDSITQLSFNPQGTLLLSSSADGECRLWDVNGSINSDEHTHKASSSKTTSKSSSCSASDFSSSAFRTLRCLQVLRTDSDCEFIKSEFNYEGDLILAATREGECCVWKKTAPGEKKVMSART